MAAHEHRVASLSQVDMARKLTEQAKRILVVRDAV